MTTLRPTGSVPAAHYPPAAASVRRGRRRLVAPRLRPAAGFR